MRISLLIIIIFVLLSAHWGNQNPPREKNPPPQPAKPETGVYTDKELSVYLKDRTLTIIWAGSGVSSSLDIPPPCFEKSPSSLKNSAVRTVRENGALRLYENRTVYDIHLAPRPRVTAVYPDPGCGGDKIIVDKHKNTLYLYKKGRLAKVCSVSTGIRPEYTPEGEFRVVNKLSFPHGSTGGRYGPRWLGIAVPYHSDLRSSTPDPRSPIGVKYGLHGTNEPGSIGAFASGGCVRLKNEDIEAIYELVEIGTPVEIIR